MNLIKLKNRQYNLRQYLKRDLMPVKRDVLRNELISIEEFFMNQKYLDPTSSKFQNDRMEAINKSNNNDNVLFSDIKQGKDKYQDVLFESLTKDGSDSQNIEIETNMQRMEAVKEFMGNSMSGVEIQQFSEFSFTPSSEPCIRMQNE